MSTVAIRKYCHHFTFTFQMFQDEKSTVCLLCTDNKIILNYWCDLLINIREKIAGNYLNYLSAAKGFVCECRVVKCYNGTVVQWYNSKMARTMLQ